MKREFENRELAVPPIRHESFLDFNPPPDLFSGLNSESGRRIEEVFEAIRRVKVIEYYGRPGRYQIVVVQGLHGEETKRINGATLAAEELDKTLVRDAADITGNIIIIPNANAPGCAFMTNGNPDPKRWVFPDETIRSEDKKVHNLNNVFNNFITGEWDEFKKLIELSQPKTAMYGWLLMKFLEAKRLDHEIKNQKLGLNLSKSVLFDLHRNDRVTIPTVFIDWFKNDKEVVLRLINEVKNLTIPQILEGEYWEIQKLYETLTAVATRRGFYSYTIEDTNMYNPDPNVSLYTAYQIQLYMMKSGIIEMKKGINPEEKFYTEVIRTSPILARGEVLSRRQKEKKKMHQLYFGGEIVDVDGQTLDENTFLEILANAGGDSIFRVKYYPASIGWFGADGQKIMIGEGEFGKTRNFSKPDFFITLSDLNSERQIVSLPASPFGKPYVEFGIFEDEGSLEARQLEPETIDLRLSLQEIAEKARNAKVSIELHDLHAAIVKVDDRIEIE